LRSIGGLPESGGKWGAKWGGIIRRKPMPALYFRKRILAEGCHVPPAGAGNRRELA
jgi:hypothetical protein